MNLSKLTLLVCLPVAAVFLNGCEEPWQTRKTSDTAVIIDPTSTTQVVSQRVLRRVTARAVRDGSTIALLVMDDRGARRLVHFTPATPHSTARKALLLHQREQERDAEQLFTAVLPEVFGSVPRASPVAASILVSTTNRQGPLEVYYVGDARETVLANFERGDLPSMEEWLARLEQSGYTKDCLNGVNVHIVGMPLISSSDKSPNASRRGIMIQELWRGLSEFGAPVTFEDDQQTDSPLGAFLVIPFAVGFGWRKLRIWMIGRSAGKREHYDVQGDVESLISHKPLPEFDDARVLEAQQTLQRERDRGKTLREEIDKLRSIIARQPMVWPRLIGITIAGVFDAAMSGTLAKSMGVPYPEYFLLGGTIATGLIMLAYAAARAAKIDGKKPWWWWAGLGIMTVIILSLTMVRVSNAESSGENLMVIISMGIVQTIGVIGPAALIEFLLHQLRPVLPNTKERRDKKSQLKESLKLHKAALDFLTKQAALRMAWDNEFTILSNIYKRAYRAARRKTPTSPDVEVAPPPTSDTSQGSSASKVNELPTWPS